ncbi:sodium- and chloride-dependent glycine transporter 1-like [Pomacea canaliculata]|uniref:sodium- and chloride-dependent glycine transporter 1-like n=1 Tax=Pomacea canaliculata TaxID=400727 RepID=UPI000D73BA21|nr:sodium- and chloride-dependent glycine transporter 1-like [Pomacea canaliculata]
MDENHTTQPEPCQSLHTVNVDARKRNSSIPKGTRRSFFSDESCDTDESRKRESEQVKPGSTQNQNLNWLQNRRFGRRSEHSGPDVRQRAGFARSLDYFISLAALIINLESMWSFPAVLGQDKSIVCFFPYIVALSLIGLPLAFLEASLGQFCSQNAIRCWDLAPLFRGIGVAMVINAFWWSWYFSLMQAITQFYIFSSFEVPLPWKTCQNTWNTDKCYNTIQMKCAEMEPGDDGVCYQDNKFEGIWNISLFAASANRSRYIISSLEYWENHVWNCPSNAKSDLFTTFNYSLMGSLFITWFAVFLILSIGILSSTKVLYFTVIFPFIILSLMLINALLQPGAAKGLLVLFRFEPDLLLEPEIWKHVVEHMLHDLGVGVGAIITLSSYAPFHHNTLRDVLIVVFIKDVTSIVWGIIIFSYLGNMVDTMNLSFADLQSEFKGLNNIVILTHGVSSIRRSSFWSILIFFSLTLWCFNPMAEITLTALVAVVSEQALLGKWRHVLLVFTCVLGFCTSVPFTSNCGMDWIIPFAFDSSAIPVTYTVVIELLVMVGVYGTRRFKNDVEVMKWRPISVYWTFAWTLAIPILITILLWALVCMIIYYQPANFFSIIVIISPLLGFLITMIVQVATEGTADTITQKLQALARPKVTWGPFHVKHRRLVKHVKDWVVDPWANEQKEGMQHPIAITRNQQSIDIPQPEVLVHSPSGQLTFYANPIVSMPSLDHRKSSTDSGAAALI